jgi:hypothetical protein
MTAQRSRGNLENIKNGPAVIDSWLCYRRCIRFCDISVITKMNWRCFCGSTDFKILNYIRSPRWLVKAECKKCQKKILFTKYGMYLVNKIFPAPEFSRVKGVEP